MSERKLVKGCVVFMKGSSGLTGYGNPQCVREVHHKSLGTISLYGHNQHYKTYDIDKIAEYPPLETAANSHDALLAACELAVCEIDGFATNVDESVRYRPAYRGLIAAIKAAKKE